ncbi:DNA-binding protein [Nonomuraea jabiensis]|uniref:Uncharacterized protein n=1 Tax=Nonomuraea jabiensis TaxID=882448 RepID=A0A7W9FYQ8_9ACTN|nr:DNA-binding protein [Nonomuraea jabiensis]MBB5774018.1 hypothetical protein [Nonomuraea jabiensis]
MTSTTPARDSGADAVGVPEVVGLLAARRLLGMGCTKAYRLANADAFPRRVLRIGGRCATPIRGLWAPLDPTNPDRSGRPASEKG